MPPCPGRGWVHHSSGSGRRRGFCAHEQKLLRAQSLSHPGPVLPLGTREGDSLVLEAVGKLPPGDVEILLFDVLMLVSP